MPKLKELTDTWSGAGQPDIIAQWGKMRLVHYLARGPRRHPVPVLIVSPLLAKPYVLDLAPGLSLVDHLVERGLELFLLDFGIPDRRDRQLRFEDHLGVVDLAMNELLAQTGPSGRHCSATAWGDLCHRVRRHPPRQRAEPGCLGDPGRLLQGRPGVPICPRTGC